MALQTILPRKFSDTNDIDNMVMMRIPEIMLDKAEALVMLNGVNQPSIDLLNQIHQRSFVPGQAPPLIPWLIFPVPRH